METAESESIFAPCVLPAFSAMPSCSAHRAELFDMSDDLYWLASSEDSRSMNAFLQLTVTVQVGISHHCLNACRSVAL